MKADDIAAMALAVTNKWAKQRKSEVRSARAASRREYMYSDRVNHSDVAHKIIPHAYAKVSDNGRLTASQRQLYYASRAQFFEMTDRELDYKYFAQVLLRKYLQRPETANWKVSRDARGTLIEPHTNKQVPVGTLQIDSYLAKCITGNTDWVPRFDTFKTDFPTCGPANRYQALLYLEKEGFNELLREVKLAERYDIAIMSCKGQSVIAARKLVDQFCHDQGIPLLVLHDFDKYGFEIAHCLGSTSWAAEDAGRVAYRFRNEINVVDLGLRLTDVEEWELESEPCPFSGGFDPACDMTDAEKLYLRRGRRVELNAFLSADFVAFVEEKLRGAGINQKLLPDDKALEGAYRRAHLIARMNAIVEDAREDQEREVDSLKLPKGLRRKLRKALKECPEKPWDTVLYDIVNEAIAEK